MRWMSTTASYKERRWTVMRETDLARVLIVVYTMRADRVRVVTGYQASARMRAGYLRAKGR